MNADEPKKVPLFAGHALGMICTALSALILVMCAGQAPPSGGPPDTVPPVIVKTVPDTNSVRVETNSVELEFSKYVDRQSVEQSIFISPYVGELEFDWSGKSVKVNFSQRLRRNATYVVNVGTDVIDLRRPGNRMAAGFALAFSTGDSIDRCSISGRVFDEKPEGIMIFAYALLNLNPDTLNPGKLKPDYVTQTGKQGAFTVSHVATGTYRIFAIRDEYKNLLYDKEVDQYGVTDEDVVLTAEKAHVAGLVFRMSKEDTTKPFLTSAAATNRRRVLIRFSQPIDSLSFRHSVVTLVDTLRQKGLPVLVSYLDRSNSTVAGIVTRETMDSAATIRVHVAGVVDRAGNPIDTAHSSYVFQGSSLPDTARASIRFPSLADSAQSVMPEEPVEIHFSQPVEQDPLSHGIVLSDTLRRPVETSLKWYNATDAGLFPAIALRENTWYRLQVVMDSVRDYSGNTYRDSMLTVRFKTLNYRTTGVIEGSVEDARHDERKGTIYLTAASIDSRPPYTKTTRLPGPGKFIIEHLVEGKYLLSGFIDSDSSGGYSYGRPFPFQPSERFSIYPDTIKVRARWGVEGVVVTFR